MKYFLLIAMLLPILAFGQVRIESLVSKDGKAYEKGATAPFTGKAIKYFPNGDIQTSLEYKAGLPDGEIINWYKKDVKQLEGFVENGLKTGVWKLYFENGKLKKQTTYKYNLENGEESFWFEDGTLQKRGSYTNGQLHGKYEWFYENGQKKQEGFYVFAKEDSTWSDWYENGKPKMVGHFTNFEKNGAWTWWDENGNVTQSKTYKNGLLQVDKDNFDTYLEKMEFSLSKRNFKESLKYVELAEGTIADKTEGNPVYMNLAVYHSKCYSTFSHYRQGEKKLLDVIGLTSAQSQTIQNTHTEKSPEKIKKVIQEITKKDQSDFRISNHIALALCYNILGDTVALNKEQQLMMEKGNMQDWIIQISLELYKLAGERFYHYSALEDMNKKIDKEGASEELELNKAYFLIRTENFKEAQKITDKYLKSNERNLQALLLSAEIEMALGNVDKMAIYERKALAIDPNVFSKTKK